MDVKLFVFSIIITRLLFVIFLTNFRVNSIRLGYTFPEKISRKLHLSSLRLHFEARNPFVIASNYDGYFDPETYGNIYAQPMARTYSVGLNITF